MSPPLKRASRMARRASLCLVLMALSCGPPDADPHSGRVDLLAELERADVSIAGLDLITAPLGPGRPRDHLVAARMGTTQDPRWWIEGSTAESNLPTAQVDGEPVLSLEASGGTATILLPSDPFTNYRVTVRWRAESSARGELALQPLAAEPSSFDDPGGVRSFARAQLANPAAMDSAEGRVVALTPGESWQETETQIARQEGRRSLLLSLRATDGAVAIDRVEVRRLTVLERFIEMAPPEPGRSPLYRRLRLPSQVCDCLLLPSGTSVAYSLRVPTEAPRLDTEARIFGSAPGASAIVARVDGEVVGRAPATAAAGAGTSPWRIELDEHAGRRIELELSLEGSSGAVGALTAPRVLGSGDTRPAVVLLSLDTLRADHLGVYGETRPLSPHIDRLAQRGTLFERVVSPSSYTLPTHATILTGQHPLVHGVHRRSHRIEPLRSELLADRLRADGYLTAGFTGGGYVSPAFGFARGFDQYSTRDPGVTEHRLAQQRRGLSGEPVERGAVVNEARMGPVLDWMERHDDQPYLLFVHTYLVHGYLPQRRYLDRLGARADLDPATLDLDRLWRRAEDGDDSAIEALRVLYAATVAQADDLVVRPLIEAIERRREAGGETYLVLLSDHGEELLEHGDLGHGGALWQELVHVPWILVGPGVPEGQRWRDPVELADVAPTILGLLGLSPSERATGRPRLLADADGEILEFALHHQPNPELRWEGLVTERWKLMVRQGRLEPEWRLFDLEQDPLERRDLSTLDPAALAELQERWRRRNRELRRFGESLPGTIGEEELPSSVVQELRALGYADE